MEDLSLPLGHSRTNKAIVCHWAQHFVSISLPDLEGHSPSWNQTNLSLLGQCMWSLISVLHKARPSQWWLVHGFLTQVPLYMSARSSNISWESAQNIFDWFWVVFFWKLLLEVRHFNEIRPFPWDLSREKWLQVLFRQRQTPHCEIFLPRELFWYISVWLFSVMYQWANNGFYSAWH